LGFTRQRTRTPPLSGWLLASPRSIPTHDRAPITPCNLVLLRHASLGAPVAAAAAEIAFTLAYCTHPARRRASPRSQTTPRRSKPSGTTTWQCTACRWALHTLSSFAQWQAVPEVTTAPGTHACSLRHGRHVTAPSPPLDTFGRHSNNIGTPLQMREWLRCHQTGCGFAPAIAAA
jgi:hypothetical protein